MTSTSRRHPTTAFLHSTLFHPSIVSLFSTFRAPSGYYQVLELHQEGTLTEFLHAREPHVLTESELRGLARTLVDALVYLKKELVLHRDINPSQLMITKSGRVVRKRLKRLCSPTYVLLRNCLVSAQRSGSPTWILLPSSFVAQRITYLREYEPFLSRFAHIMTHFSREILLGQPYGFGTDLWSVGCLLVTCISGSPAFSVGPL